MNDATNPYQSPAESTFSPVDFSPQPAQGVFRPASTLCLTLTVLLGIQVVLDLGLLGMSGMEWSYYNQGVAFDEFSMTEEELTFLIAYAGLGVLQLLTLIVTAIFFCIWNYRVYKNVLALGVSRLQHSPGWAAGAWFVPILNWFRPYQIMQETWKGSEPSNLRKEGEMYHRPVGSSLVGWWWAAWIIGGLVNQVAFRAEMHAEGDLEVLQISAIASMIGAVITIACGVMAISIVRSITANQEERHQLVRGATPAQVLY